VGLQHSFNEESRRITKVLNRLPRCQRSNGQGRLSVTKAGRVSGRIVGKLLLHKRRGFHQVAIKYPASAAKTAFVTHRGLFQFRSMPFGLCNAVATFQRLMDIGLSEIGLDFCLAYLDDVCLHSVTLEQHPERLEVLFQKLKAVNLKLKPSKCFFMQTSIKFLGHVVSKDGLATDAEKIRLAADWPVPTNLKQLRGFLRSSMI